MCEEIELRHSPDLAYPLNIQEVAKKILLLCPASEASELLTSVHCRYGRLKRAELPEININTGAQSINTESLFNR